LIPADDAGWLAVTQWIHASEATFFLHALAVMYARRMMEGDKEAVQRTESKLGLNVNRDMSWLEKELSESSSGWLVGSRLTAADINMHFKSVRSCSLICG
jgi:glutathione S-transferase